MTVPRAAAPTTERITETPEGLRYEAEGEDFTARIELPDTMWRDPRWRWLMERLFREPAAAERRDDDAEAA